MKKRSTSQKNNKNLPGSYLPFGIKLISALSIIISILLLFSASVFFATYNLINSSPDIIIKESMKQLQSYSYNGINLTEGEIKQRIESAKVVFPILGITSIIIMLLYFISAIFLLKEKNWARIIQVILSLLSILLSLVFISGPLLVPASLSLIINTIIAGYLLFNQNIKKIF